MRLTVLGSSPASTNPGGASSSYLLTQGTTKLVVDCGNGSLGQLAQHVAPEDVDAIIISHMHFDHTLDLIPYRYALAFNQEAQVADGGGATVRRPALWLPPEAYAALLQVAQVQDASPTFFSEFFDVQEYDPQRALTVGPLTVAFLAVRHRPHTYAMRIMAGDRTLTYSADTGPCDGIVTAARNADLFLCECSNAADNDYAGHLTAAQAGEVAQQAGARRLVLTHRWYRTGLEAALAEAATTYNGPIELAAQGGSWDI